MKYERKRQEKLEREKRERIRKAREERERAQRVGQLVLFVLGKMIVYKFVFSLSYFNA